MPDAIMIGVTADTDTFPVDSVNLNLHFGFFPTEDDTPKSAYTRSDIGSGEVFFALYVCNRNELQTPSGSIGYEDYRVLENQHFIRKISEAEAFTAEYSYPVQIIGGITYQHQESIYIPEILFTEGIYYENQGLFYITIIAWQQSPETGMFYLVNGNDLDIEYHITKNGYVAFSS